MTELLITERRAGPDAPPAAWEPEMRPDLAPVPRTFTPDLDGAAVLDEVCRFIRRFWISPSQSAVWVMALWAAHTWAVDEKGVLAFYDTPRIAFVSDQPGSGKSRALELLGLLCRNAEQVLDPTGPAMLKAINQRRAVLLVDEGDQLLGNGTAAKSVRTILNGGYRKGASVLRCSGDGNTFAPAGVAGLASSIMGNPTLEPMRQRCVIIVCERPPAGVKPDKYRAQFHAGLGALAGDALGAWVQSKIVDIVTVWPEMPSHLDGRQEDVWTDLFAIAQVAGGEWPERILQACMEFTTGTSADEAPLPPRARLLADIRAVWPEGADRMPAAALVGALSELPGAPWAGMWSPVAMLAEIPAMLGISPARIESGGHEVQGYWLAQLAPLWADETDQGI